MKTLLSSLLALFATSAVMAQKPDSLLARVRYTYVNTTDTLKSGKTRTENMLLFLGKNASLYTSYDKIRYEISQDQKYRAKMMANAGSGKPVAILIDNTNGEWLSTSSNLYFSKENKFFTKEVIALQSYLIEEPAPQINWKITKDTTSFSGLSCKKAIANFEGKNWIAWFAPSLPFQTGPWKLNSLPGLIIEAYEENKLIQFQFAGLESVKEGEHQRIDDVTKRADARPGDYNPIDQLIGRDVGTAYFENVIKLPIGAIRADKEKFEKLRAAFLKDPAGFVRTRSRY
ncbi:GLPGLI family protein [Pedobacter sp. Hv1]|uniref:GLPGLI family protein n=1 Tax=Pedobacter sp. Hv1 TaxID=1740090 RepID=UPI0006E652DA|nr:GLPGLI family protein [Pedobacter sp. Hv1]KQB98939.1 hypothetical protein AQF98_19615 [Pedobacter sp. Hv1]